MAELHLDITGDNSGAIAALAETQAAIDALHGRSVEVSIGVHGGDAAVSDLNDVGRAASGVSDTPAHVNVDHGDVGAARDDLRGLRGEARDAARELGRGLGDDGGRGARAIENTTRAIEGAGDSLRELESSGSMRSITAGAQDASRAMGELSSSGGLRAITAGSEDAARGMRAIESGSSDAAVGMRAMTAGSVDAASGMRAIEAGSSDAASGMRSIEGGMRAIESGSSGARAGMSDFTEETHRASAAADDGRIHISAVGRLLGDAGGEAGSGMRAITSGLTDVASESESAASAAGPLIAGWSGAGEALGKMGGPLMAVGLASGVSALGMGALGAATAAVGIGAVAGDIAKSEPMMAAMRHTVTGFARDFSDMSSQTAAAGLPMMGALQQATQGLGKSLAALGVAETPAVLQAVTDLAGSATQMVGKLAPAIGPSIQAATSLGGAIMGAMGDSAPQIGQFANVVTQSSAGLQQATDGAVRLATNLGGPLVQAVASAGPQIKGLANIAGGAADLAIGAYGGQSSYSSQPDASGQTPPQSFLSKVGSVAAVAGRFIPGVGAVEGAVEGLGDIGTPGMGFRSQDAPTDPSSRFSAQFPGPTGGLDTSQPGGGPTPNWAPPSSAAGPGGRIPDFQPPPGAPGGPPAAPPPPPSPTAPGSAAAGMPDMLKPPAPGDQAKPPPPPPRAPAPGTSGTPMNPAQVQALNQALQQTPANANAMTAAMQRLGPTTAASMSQVGSAAQSAPPQMQQGMSQMQHAVQSAPPAVASAAAQIPPAIHSAMQTQPQAMTAPMQSMVKAAVTQSAPAAQSGGADVGASMTSGAGQGITKTETETLTIVKKWITKVIDAGAAALDAHSPSRVFAVLGESIPQGLGVGVQSAAGTAITATQSLIGQVTQGAQAQLAGAQGHLGKSVATAITPSPAAITAAATAYQPPAPPGPAAGQRDMIKPPADVKAQQDQQQQKQETDQQKADEKRQQEAQKDADRRKTLTGLGYNPATVNRVDAQEKAHNDRADQMRQDREQRHEAALQRARTGMPSDASDPKAIQRDAQAWENAGIGKTEADQAQHAKDLVQKTWQPKQQPAPPPPAPVSSSFIQNSIAQTGNQGQQIGGSLSSGVQQGIGQGGPGVNDAAAKMMQMAADAAKKKAGISSPSQVFSDVGSNVAAGLVGGMGSGVQAAADGVMPIADSSGLMVGYVWARSVSTGIDSVMKSADFMSAAVPQIDSALAKTALGQLGLLGTAGSGAQVWKTPAITMDSGSAPVTPQVNATIIAQFGNQTIQAISQKVVDVSMDQLADSIGRQRTS